MSDRGRPDSDGIYGKFESEYDWFDDMLKAKANEPWQTVIFAIVAIAILVSMIV
jgi:hypothetical protein